MPISPLGGAKFQIRPHIRKPTSDFKFLLVVKSNDMSISNRFEVINDFLL